MKLWTDSFRHSCLHLCCSEGDFFVFFCLQTKSIKDLLTSGDLGGKNISGKVVQKSALRTYQTKQKKKENKVFFYLGFTDDTSCIKVMVYGKDRYQGFKEGSFYSIREVIMEENLMKITKRSSTAKTSPFDIPEELEMEAQMLIYPQTPVCCIAKAKVYADRTAVSVEGTVTEVSFHSAILMKSVQSGSSCQCDSSCKE